MKTNRMRTWREFREVAQGLLREHKQLKTGPVSYVSDVLFRGQANAHSWKLETTLDRYLRGRDLSMNDYRRIVADTLPTLRSDFSESHLLEENLQIQSLHSFRQTKNSHILKQYMAHLRHRGFPSPLLDWSSSYDVAGFFAFAEPGIDEYMAVYVFREYVGQSKMTIGGEAKIEGIGPVMNPHPRHQAQNGQYTFCTKEIEQDNFYYTPHEHAFNRQSKTQDLLVKFEIPSSERNVVLGSLFERGIHATALFPGDPDAVVRDLAFQLIESKLGRENPLDPQ